MNMAVVITGTVVCIQVPIRYYWISSCGQCLSALLYTSVCIYVVYYVCMRALMCYVV